MLHGIINRSIWRLGRLAFLAVLILSSAACGTQDPWNVLVITFDTTRADRIGAYGNEAIDTPNLDRLAREGVLFHQAFSAIPITTPSHSTIMTGKYPLAHGVRDNGQFTLAEHHTTLAETLASQGYATGAAIGAFPLIKRFGVHQGFDFYDDKLPGPFQDMEGNRVPRKRSLFFDERRAAQVNEAAFPWLDDHHAEPFFLWVHYFDPHQPFVPPPPYDQLYADDLYSGEIAYADACLGTLLDRLETLGVYDRTLIVMAADHGEGLGDHNELTHAILAYNSTLRVPLIIRVPGGKPRVVESRVGTVDIAPTILELLDIEEPVDVQGRSLVPLIAGGSSANWDLRSQYAENLSPRISHFWGELRVLFTEDYKYIHGPRRELYNLRSDPRELSNLVEEEPEIAAGMESRLADFLQTNASHGASVPQELSPEMVERLRALGYLQASVGGGEAIVEELRSDGVPPQDRVGDINDLSTAKALLYEERFEEARRYIGRLLETNPDSPLYLELSISVDLGLGDVDSAWSTLNQLRETFSAEALPERILLQTAALRFLKGDRLEALKLLEDHQATKPSPQAQHLLANMYTIMDRREEGKQALLRALELRAGYAPARLDLAILEAQSSQSEEAENHFLQILYDEPYYAKAHFNYGAFLIEQERIAEAAREFERAIELWPRYGLAYQGLIAVQLSQGQKEEARLTLGRLISVAPQSAAARAARDLVESSS